MTARVLVAYGSKFGATAEIAEAIGAALRDEGLAVDVSRARDVRTVDDYDAVVLGSAVYMARWRPDAARLLRRRRRELAQRKVWLFSSGPVGAQADADRDAPGAERDAAGAAADRWTRPRKVQELADEIGAREHVVFAGAVSDGAGGMIRRKMAKDTPPEQRDRRDWDEIARWARSIAAAVA